VARVLYVEDNNDFREMALSSKGLFPDLELIVASDYAEAAAALKNHGPFDLIISDFQYPGIEGNKRGGLDLFLLAKQNYPQTPFLYLSRRPTDEIVQAVQEKGLHIPAKYIFSKDVTTFEEVVTYGIEQFCPNSAIGSLAHTKPAGTEND